MGAHWLSPLPVIMAYGFSALQRRRAALYTLRAITFALCLFLFAWNFMLYSNYLWG